MRAFFVYLGMLLWLAAVVSALLFIVNPGSATLVGSGGVFPGYNTTTPVPYSIVPSAPVGLPFVAPGPNATQSFTLSYEYGNTSTSVQVFQCPWSEQSLRCAQGTGSALLTLNGPSNHGEFQGRSGIWYVVSASDPVRANVQVPATPSALAEEGAAVGAAALGAALLVLGLILRDPLGRPAPRLAQMKRTLYFFFQSKLAVLGLALLLGYAVVALLSPVLAPYSPSVGACTPPGCNGDYVTLPEYRAYTPYFDGSSYNPSTMPDISTHDWQCVYPSYAAAGSSPPGDCVAYSASLTGIQFRGSPNLILPTWTLYPFNPGPVPLGSLQLESTPNGPYVDIYTGLVRATPWDLTISAGIVSAGALVGLLLGTFAGYKGGIADEVVMRLTDMFLSIPAFFLVLVILAALFAGGPNSLPHDQRVRIAFLMGAFIITWWPSYTRIIRGQVLVTREQKYVEAARASGAGSGWMLRKHIIPNSIFPLLVSFSLDVGTVPLALANIGFLGFTNLLFPTTSGAPFPEWGILSSYEVGGGEFYATVISGSPFPWWEYLFPGLALFLFCIAVNFLSDGLRDALDPRLRR
ncbi:MAG: ABC transporter permease [Euryarchaeota archaeon]|nr:ABC transporter permease [Euryarchaeota archaeon]MDE1836099.1 ABC transporter permease [Euryarchaeota archaeon]MDE1879389.1 ABC transporter permease [Euryarchaeota archaeon]MDE2044077.1 ABC transporter permease [Thermoplasmata archaeon]